MIRCGHVKLWGVAIIGTILGFIGLMYWSCRTPKPKRKIPQFDQEFIDRYNRSSWYEKR